MSRETIEWLNENTYVGMLASREFHAKNNWMIMDDNGGVKPWWHRDYFAHGYQGFIPTEDVLDGLFNWEPVESVVRNMVPCTEADSDGVDGNGNHFRIVIDEKRKGIVHPTKNTVYGYFGIDSYTVHSYSEWLIGKILKMLEGGGGLTSAGLLQDGGQAYVTMEAPEGFEVGGLDVRPMIVGGTSCNGTMVSKYTTSAYAAICDNSFNEIMTGAAKVLKIKHSSKSMGKLEGAGGATALGLINVFAEELSVFLDSMMNVDVTDSEFHRIINGLVPDVEAKVEAGKVTNQRAITIMEGKRGELLNLWKVDPRVAKWNGTLFGAFQAANTWSQHFRSNNDNAVERGITGVLNGQFAAADQVFWGIVKDIETIQTKGLILATA